MRLARALLPLLLASPSCVRPDAENRALDAGPRPVEVDPRPVEVDPRPVEVEWGTELCASCRMHVERPGFAVQNHAPTGEVGIFDDLGCLAIEVLTGRLQPGVVYFQHVDGERWVPAESAGFVRHPDTPMLFGYAAVDAEHGELTFDDVCAEMDQRFSVRADKQR
jgi:hypothetical protein